MEKKAERAPNFTVTEKELLLSIVAKYKNIIECKKRDGANWHQKNEVWKQITQEFNSQSCVARGTEALRKLYDNLKHAARVEAAAEKKKIGGTGGGPPYKKLRTGDNIHEKVLEIINKKTVFGLSNPVDDDIIIEASSSASALLHWENENPPDDHNKDHNFFKINTSSKTIASNKNQKPQNINKLREDHYEIQINKEGPASACDDTIKKTGLPNDFSILKERPDPNLIHSWTNRAARRHPVREKNLQDSYSELAQIKMELYAVELQLAKERIEREKELYILQKESLMLDIRKKKLELKRFEHLEAD